jgi:hypothetical protein
MLLHTLINKLCCECFQFQTKKHEDTQTITEPLLPIETRQNQEKVPKFLRRMKRKHGVHMQQAKKTIDGHGHMFYCFSCRNLHKDHRSFDSKEAIEMHCKDKHNLKIII